MGAPRGAFLLLKWREPLYCFRVKPIITLFSLGSFLLALILLREVSAQTSGEIFYVQVSLSPDQASALTNAAAIINVGRTGYDRTPFVNPSGVFMTITSKDINDLCDRLISTDPKTLVRRFNRKDRKI